MQEELVTLETAQLAQAKGFNVFTDMEYLNSGKVSERIKCSPNRDCSAPTQALLQKWLREKHTIVINVTHKPFNQSYGFSITGKFQEGDQGVLQSYNFTKYDTYELALEAGLLAALNYIK